MELRQLNNTLESGGVLRYHAVPSVKPQTVAQHCWGVAMLAHYISDDTSEELIMECLLHDSAELFTGDIPFTVKRDNPSIKSAFRELESFHREHDILPGGLTGYHALCTTQSEMEHLHALLKVCDTLEGFIWCANNENRIGKVGSRWKEAYQHAQVKFKDILTPEEWQRADAVFEHYSNNPANYNTTNAP